MVGLLNRLLSTSYVVCMEKELNKKNRSELFAFITDAVGNVKRNQKYDIAIGAFFLNTCRCMCLLYDADIKLRMASSSSHFFAIYLTGFGLVVA